MKKEAHDSIPDVICASFTVGSPLLSQTCSILNTANKVATVIRVPFIAI